MKNTKSNILIIILIVIVILLGIIVAYRITNKNNEASNTEFNEASEKVKLEEDIKNIKSDLGFIAILSSIDNSNDGENYQTKKNENLLQDVKSKQLFVLEQILKDTNNYKNFIVLDTNGKINNKETSPTMEGTFAYYPYDLFKEEYTKYFEETFNIEERQVSNMNTIYDSNENYIYYENRRAGANGLSITEMIIDNIEEINANKYKANITLNYNERASEMLGVKTEKVELIYNRNDNNIKIESYILKNQ